MFQVKIFIPSLDKYTEFLLKKTTLPIYGSGLQGLAICLEQETGRELGSKQLTSDKLKFYNRKDLQFCNKLLSTQKLGTTGSYQKRIRQLSEGRDIENILSMNWIYLNWRGNCKLSQFEVFSHGVPQKLIQNFFFQN